MAYENGKQIQAPEQEEKQRPEEQQISEQGLFSMPNSLMLAMPTPPPGTPNSVMREMLDHQIPAAEEEADRLSVGIRGRSPQAVRREMGRRLGSDFSSVRFHTGPESIRRNEAMGSLAYTRGNDVWFGRGGFDPVIGAHELVHTVQQRIVPGNVSQTVPAGTVQMFSLRDKFRSTKLGTWLHNLGDRIKKHKSTGFQTTNPKEEESIPERTVSAPPIAVGLDQAVPESPAEPVSDVPRTASVPLPEEIEGEPPVLSPIPELPKFPAADAAAAPSPSSSPVEVANEDADVVPFEEEPDPELSKQPIAVDPFFLLPTQGDAPASIDDEEEPVDFDDAFSKEEADEDNIDGTESIEELQTKVKRLKALREDLKAKVSEVSPIPDVASPSLKPANPNSETANPAAPAARVPAHPDKDRKEVDDALIATLAQRNRMIHGDDDDEDDDYDEDEFKIDEVDAAAKKDSNAEERLPNWEGNNPENFAPDKKGSSRPNLSRRSGRYHGQSSGMRIVKEGTSYVDAGKNLVAGFSNLDALSAMALDTGGDFKPGTGPSYIEYKANEGLGLNGATSLAGAGTAAVSTVTNAADTVRHLQNIKAGESGADAAQSALDTLSSAGTTLSNGAAFLETVGAMSPAADFVPGMNIATGAVTAISGSVQAIRGRRAMHKINVEIRRLQKQIKRKKLEALMNDEAAPAIGTSSSAEETEAEAAQGNDTGAEKGPETPEQRQKRLLHIFHHGLWVSEYNRTAGGMKAASGVLTAGSGIATLTGAGVAVGAGLGAASAGLGVGRFAYEKVKKRHIRHRVIAQELGISEKEVKDDTALAAALTRANNGVEEGSQLGGSRKEIFAQIKQRRARYLLDLAGRDALPDPESPDYEDAKAADNVINALGVHRNKDGSYASGAEGLLAEKLG